jgi:hypothetical protein
MITKEQIAYERADFARDVEYIRSMVNDSEIQEAVYSLEEYKKGIRGIFESDEDDDPELIDAVDQIPVDDSDKEIEIERILNSNSNMSIDDIMGLSDDGDEINDAIDIADDELENIDDGDEINDAIDIADDELENNI